MEGVQKVKNKVKDWGLDKGPIEHIASRITTAARDIKENRDPELRNTVSTALNTGRILLF
jgi:hypothetical protein